MKLRLLKRFLKLLLWLLTALLVVALLFIGILFFREQRIPEGLVRTLEAAVSSDGVAVRLGSASFGLRSGLRLRDVRVYDLSRENPLENPIGSASFVHLDYFGKTIYASDATYVRLPDSYYSHEEGEEAPEPPAPVELPANIPEFKVVLDHPKILGLEPDRVTLDLRVEPRRLSLERVHFAMPDRDRYLALDGELDVDFGAMRLDAGLRGTVRHSQIAPVVEVFDAPVALPYIADCTELTGSIPMDLRVGADFAAGTVDLAIRYEPRDFRYRGVPFSSAHGSIDLSVRSEETNFVYAVTVGVGDAQDRDGRRLDGRLTVSNREGPSRLYFDADSTLAFPDLLSVVNELDPEWFDGIAFDTPPHVTAGGRCGFSLEDVEGNAITGRVSALRGTVDRLRAGGIEAGFTLRRDVLSIMGARAVGTKGGVLEWSGRIFFAGFDGSKSHFSVSAAYDNGSLEEFAEVLPFDLGGRHGTVSASLELCGYVATNRLDTLDGYGHVEMKDGMLSQMRLFSGLTSWLAKNVPGISFLTDLSKGSVDFTVKDGVFRTDNMFVGSGFFEMRGAGSYDMVADDIDFSVRIQMIPGDSLAGKIASPVTSTLTRLLLDFKVTGPLDAPSWKAGESSVLGLGPLRKIAGWLF